MTNSHSNGITIRRGPMASDVLGKHFTQIYNYAMRDTRLTYRARGVLGSLLTHTEGYGITIKFLVAGSPEGREGRDAIASALRELEQFGYLHRKREVDPVTKKMGGTEYKVTDMPDGFSVEGKSPWSEPETDKPELGNAAGPSLDTCFQGQGFQGQGFQSLESPTLKKTNGRTPPEEHTEPEGVPAEVVDRVCKKLADTIRDRGLKRPKVTYAWKDAARDLLTPDEGGFSYTIEEIEGGIDWAQAHPFWSSRVMTMRKFTEHFPKIMSQARGELGDPKTEVGKKAHDDLVSRRLKRLDQMESDLEAKLGRALSFAERRKMQEFVKEEIQ